MSANGSAQQKMWWLRLVRRVARATGKPDEAEDYLHSAFLKLEAYRLHKPVDNPDGFLVKVAANIALDDGRHERVKAEIGRSIYDLVNLVDLQPLQDEALAACNRLERVKVGLDALTPRTRTIFLMHRVGGMKYREIAAQLGITVSAVEKHIAKAALFLADWVEGW